VPFFSRRGARPCASPARNARREKTVLERIARRRAHEVRAAARPKNPVKNFACTVKTQQKPLIIVSLKKVQIVYFFVDKNVLLQRLKNKLKIIDFIFI
jgi:hypothetical protein